MTLPTYVYLLRHGATALNREIPYRLQGQSMDPPIDAIGEAQADRAAEALSRHNLTAVYTSPLIRAQQTAARIAGPHRLAPRIVPELIEASLGRWEGLTWDQARAGDPELYDAFHTRPGTVAYPEGESFLDAQIRMLPALAALAESHPGERIAVVSHNVTNRALLAGLLGIPIDRAREIRQSNCGINLITYHDGKTVVEMINSQFHLDDA
jgi:broad specificity phosphatase PhoE